MSPSMRKELRKISDAVGRRTYWDQVDKHLKAGNTMSSFYLKVEGWHKLFTDLLAEDNSTDEQVELLIQQFKQESKSPAQQGHQVFHVLNHTKVAPAIR